MNRNLKLAVLIYAVSVSLFISGCQASTKDSVSSTPIPEPTTTAIEPLPTLLPATSNALLPTLTPDSSPVPAWADKLPFSITPKSCPTSPTETGPFSSNGRLVLAAGSQKNGDYGVYILSKRQVYPELIVREQAQIAKLAVSPNGQWLVYSTLCDPGITCPADYRPDDPAAWVTASIDGDIVTRTPWKGDIGAYDWKLIGGSIENAQILTVPGAYWMSNDLDEASVLSLPAGEIHPFPHKATLPDMFPLGGVHSSLGVEINPTLTRGFYYAFETSSQTSSLVLRDFVSNKTLWQMQDEQGILDSGYAANWAWSPNGEFIALSFSAEHQDHRKEGDVFILDQHGQYFLRISDFSEPVAGEYFASPRLWSADSQKLVIDLHTANGVSLYFADIGAGRIIGSCQDLGSMGIGAWSPDSRFFAAEVPNPSGGYSLVIIDSDNGRVREITDVPVIQSVAAWLP